MNENIGQPTKSRFSIVETDINTGLILNQNDSTSNVSPQEDQDNLEEVRDYESAKKLEGVKFMEPQYSPRDIQMFESNSPTKNILSRYFRFRFSNIAILIYS